MAKAIWVATGRLANYPRTGRPGRVAGASELVAARTPSIVIREIERDMVRILRVPHSAQCWPPIR